MPRFVTVANISDLPPGTCRTVEAEGRWIALFNVGGRIYATDNTCPHAGGPLGEGILSGEVVSCPWHGWRYNVRTGARLDNPDFSIPCFQVQLLDGQVQVAVLEE